MIGWLKIVRMGPAKMAQQLPALPEDSGSVLCIPNDASQPPVNARDSNALFWSLEALHADGAQIHMWAHIHTCKIKINLYGIN